MMRSVVIVVALSLVGSLFVLRRLRRAAPEAAALAARVATTRRFVDGSLDDRVKVEGAVELLDDMRVVGPVVEQAGVWIEVEALTEPDPDTASRSLAQVRESVPFAVGGVHVQAPQQAMAWPLVQLVRQRDSD